MFLGLNSLLDISETQLIKGKFLLLSDCQNDGSFLVHHFLSLYIKGGYKVCFLALSQSLAHYTSVAQKLGINLTAACHSGQVEYIDGLKLISQSLSNSKNVEETKESSSNPFATLRDSEFSLQSLYNQIRTCVQNSSGQCLVLIDDLGVLLTLGLPVQRVVDFCTYCTNLLCYATSQSNGCLICLVHCDDDVDDEESLLLWKHLCHTAHMELRVEGLSSGYCKDVHGQLVITWRDTSDMELKPTRRTVSQFKVQDRMVTFFAPGTSKAVL